MLKKLLNILLNIFVKSLKSYFHAAKYQLTDFSLDFHREFQRKKNLARRFNLEILQKNIIKKSENPP